MYDKIDVLKLLPDRPGRQGAATANAAGVSMAAEGWPHATPGPQSRDRGVECGVA